MVLRLRETNLLLEQRTAELEMVTRQFSEALNQPCFRPRIPRVEHQ